MATHNETQHTTLNMRTNHAKLISPTLHGFRIEAVRNTLIGDRTRVQIAEDGVHLVVGIIVR